jgi:hypothetical protein
LAQKPSADASGQPATQVKDARAKFDSNPSRKQVSVFVAFQ